MAKLISDTLSRSELVDKQLNSCFGCRVLNHRVLFEIENFQKKFLKKLPVFGPRKVPYNYAVLPVKQHIEDVITFVHNWSQRDTSADPLTRPRIIELKRRLRILEQEYAVQYEQDDC